MLVFFTQCPAACSQPGYIHSYFSLFCCCRFGFPSPYSETIPFQSTLGPVVRGNVAVDVVRVGGVDFLMEWFRNIHVLVRKQD